MRLCQKSYPQTIPESVIIDHKLFAVRGLMHPIGLFRIDYRSSHKEHALHLYLFVIQQGNPKRHKVLGNTVTITRIWLIIQDVSRSGKDPFQWIHREIDCHTVAKWQRALKPFFSVIQYPLSILPSSASHHTRIPHKNHRLRKNVLTHVPALDTICMSLCITA